MTPTSIYLMETLIMENPLNTNACFRRGSVLIIKIGKLSLQKKNVNYIAS